MIASQIWTINQLNMDNDAMKIEKQITELTKDWYSLIAHDHHKDRDCHWIIETRWSYGDEPKFIIRHAGYVYDRIEIVCNTYEEALRQLKYHLKSAVEIEKAQAQYENDLPGEIREGFEL